MTHETQPAIADLEVRDGEVVLSLELNLEAYLAGIDLDGLEDTDDAAESAEYDTLRNETPDQIAPRIPALIAAWNNVPMVSVDGTAVSLTARDIEIDPVGNPELTRPSRLVLSGPASGAEITVRWPKGAGDLVLRQQGVEDPFTGYLAGGQASPALAIGGGSASTGWGVFAEYIPVGFDHILPKGLDHILFVLGLFLLSTAWRPLLWQVTAFTAAHTVTLALGALGLVNLPGSIVEPLIAASIVYVAIENIFARRLNTWRPAIVFGFGLLHGLGFASVLGDFGLPEAQFIPALLGFNIGVELGQLTVIAMAGIVVWLALQAARAAHFPGEESAIEDYPVLFRAVSVTGSMCIALIGIWWVIERTLL
ncbi:MAG: HupE/UreJ family protein [Paracoccaceae bacterium]